MRSISWRVRARLAFAMALVGAAAAGLLVARRTTDAASPREGGTIHVTVLRGASTPMPAGGAQVRLLGTAIAAVANAQGEAAISVSSPGTYTVSAALIGYCPAKRSVTLASGGEAHVTIWMCNDAVYAHNAPGEDIVAVLDLRMLDAGVETCVNDTLFTGTRAALLATNALSLPGATPCHGAAAVLTVNRAISFSNVAETMPWTGEVGDVYDVSLPPRRLHVPITIWISDPSLSAVQTTALITKINTYHLTAVADLFTGSLTGLELVSDEATGGAPEIKNVSSIPGTPYAKVGQSCDNVKALHGTPSVYDDGRLNVYYVSSVNPDVGGSAKGYDCIAQGAPNIIYIDHNGSDHHTLAHEIGHALGLDRPEWGHTDQLADFVAGTVPLNVMATGAVAPTYFSIGQAVAMTLNTESWLNVASASDGSSSRSRQAAEIGAAITASCGCPEREATDDCPAIAHDVVRSGTKQPGVTTYLLACSVAVPSSTVSVACGSSVDIVADFRQGSSGARGEAAWISLDRDVATVTLTAESSGTSTGRVTGVAAGMVEVRAYSAGSFAPIKVTVGSCS